MSPRYHADRGKRAGNPTFPIATFILASLVLVLASHPIASNAEEVWQELWADSFEHSMNAGWTLHTCGCGDEIGVVPEGTRYPDRAGRCEPNNVLYGNSPSPDPGHGFSASTPALEELGINLDIDTYSMSFRYMVVGSEFCWTMPLVSPDANLVITECANGGSEARLGLLDRDFQNFRALTDIKVDEWHNFTIKVRPLRTRGAREVSVFIDDVLLDRHVRNERGSQRSMMFLDLPAFPVELDPADPQPQFVRGCFGEGYWDDVSLSVLRDDGLGEGHPYVQVVPTPFNPSTSICMELEASCRLDVTVFDVRGRRVRGLHAGVHPAGPVRLVWNGRNDHGQEVSSGVYLVRATIPGDTWVTRAVLVR